MQIAAGFPLPRHSHAEASQLCSDLPGLKEPEPSAAERCGRSPLGRWTSACATLASGVESSDVERRVVTSSGRDDLSPGPRRKDSDDSATQSGSLRLVKSPSC